jgi:hypothetical protein
MMNDRVRGWVSEQDVVWLSTELDAAEASAAGIDQAYGPVMVQDRDGLKDISEQHAAENASEWYEEYMGLLLKWGVPALSAVTAQYLPDDAADRGMVLQSSTTLSPSVAAAIERGADVLITGRADLLPSDVRAASGISVTDEPLVEPAYRRGLPSSPDLRPKGWVFLPSHAVIETAPEVTVRYATADTALLTENGAVVYWQPPDWADPTMGTLPHFQIGSVEPHIETARLLHRHAVAAGQLAIDEFPSHETVTMHAWRSNGDVHILLGNLESGWIGDSRYPRSISLRLPRDCVAGMARPVLKPLGGGASFGARTDSQGLVFDVTVGAESCLVARLEEEVAETGVDE